MREVRGAAGGEAAVRRRVPAGGLQIRQRLARTERRVLEVGRRLVRPPVEIAVWLRSLPLLDRAEEAGGRSFGADVVVVLVVAVGDQLPAVGGADAGAVLGDGVVVEQHDGARP